MAKCLLFCDSFTHEVLSEEVNLDLIQFSRPVVIHSIRLLPAGSSIQFDECADAFISSSLPHSFNVEVFANNLSRQNVSSFQKLGQISHGTANISSDLPPLVPDVPIPTDGIILRGRYQSLSVAVFGDFAEENVPVDFHESSVVKANDTSLTPPLAHPLPFHHPASSSISVVTASSLAITCAASLHVAPPFIAQPVAIHSPTVVAVHSSMPPHLPPSFPPASFPRVPFLPPGLTPVGNVIPTGQVPNAPGVFFDPSVPPPIIRTGMPPAIPVVSSYSTSSSSSTSATPRTGASDGTRGTSMGKSSDKYHNRGRSKDRDRFSGLREQDKLRDGSARGHARDSSYNRGHRTDSYRDDHHRYSMSNSKGRRGSSDKSSSVVGDQNTEGRSTVRRGSDQNTLPPALTQIHREDPPTIVDAVADNMQSSGAPIRVSDESMTVNDEGILEDGEYPGSDDDGSQPNFDYESISEEDFDVSDIGDIDLSEEALSKPVTSQFSAIQFEVPTLIHFHAPYLTDFQVEKMELNMKYIDDEIPEQSSIILKKVMEGVNKPYNEEWVEIVESLCSLIPTGLPFIADRPLDDTTDKNSGNLTVISQLIHWVTIGLDYDTALQQTITAYPLRHLKAGMKLTAALCMSEEPIAERVLAVDCQHKLMDLFCSAYMSFTMQLQIIQSLDATLTFKAGFDCLFSKDDSSGGSSRSQSCYERIVTAMLVKQHIRVMNAFKCLLKKISFYEMLRSLDAPVETLRCQIHALDKDAMVEIEENMCLCLKELFSAVQDMPSVAQPKKLYFPIANGKQPATAVITDPSVSVFRIIHDSSALDSVNLLCSAMASNWIQSYFDVVSAIETLMIALMRSHQGLLFLMSEPDAINSFLQTVLTTSDDIDAATEGPILYQVGMEVAHHLQAMHYVDELEHYRITGATQLEVDNAGILGVLHNLYSLTAEQASSSSYARRAVVNVLSLGDNLGCILPFIELTGDLEWDTKLKKSACAGYAVELLLCVLRCSEHTEMIERFRIRLVKMYNAQEGQISSKMAEVKQWIEILKKIDTFTVDDVPALTEQLRLFTQDEQLPRIPKGLVSVVRILKFLLVPPVGEENAFKYKYGIMVFHAENGFKPLVQAVAKVLEVQLVPWQLGFSLNSSRGHLVISFFKPSMAIIRTCLSLIIESRGAEFRDVTCVHTLMDMYTLVCTMVPAGALNKDMHQIRIDVINSLLAFTQPDISQQKVVKTTEEKLDEEIGVRERPLTDDTLKKSLWTMMLEELFKFGLMAPYTFIGSLNALSELLPLPLAVQSRQPLSDNEIEIVNNHRRLWSAHLLPLSDLFQKLIKTVVLSTFQTLQVSLRRLCIQLTDLSPPMAMVVTKSLLDALFEVSLKQPDQKTTVPDSKDTNTTSENDGQFDVKPAVYNEKDVILPANTMMAQVLNVMHRLVAHPPIKHSILQLNGSVSSSHATDATVDSGTTIDYSNALSLFLNILNHPSSQTHHVHSQELVSLIVQTLCDDRISLIFFDDDGPTTEQTMLDLASAIPDHKTLSRICRALISHVGNNQHSLQSIMHSLRTLLMLTEHEFGLYHLTEALRRDCLSTRIMVQFFERIYSEYNNDTSADCEGSVRTALDLIKNLLSQSTTKRIPAALVKQILEWKYGGQSMNENHVLVRLENQFKEMEKDDQSTVGSLSDQINCVIVSLCDLENDSDLQFDLPVMPDSLDLQELFTRRQTWQFPYFENDRLDMNDWLPNCSILEEDYDADTEKVIFDLEKIRLTYFPSLNITEELEAKLSAKYIEIKPKRKPKIINTSRGQRSAAPMRGRGFIPRGGGGGRGPRDMSDHFRNRPQNTSRPPSMHVDMFVNFEAHGTPTDNSNQPIRQNRDNRNRGNRSDRGVRMKRPFAIPNRDRDSSASSSMRRKPVGGIGGGGNNPNSRNSFPDRKRSVRSAYDDRLNQRVQHSSRQLSPSGYHHRRSNREHERDRYRR